MITCPCPKCCKDRSLDIDPENWVKVPCFDRLCGPCWHKFCYDDNLGTTAKANLSPRYDFYILVSNTSSELADHVVQDWIDGKDLTNG